MTIWLLGVVFSIVLVIQGVRNFRASTRPESAYAISMARRPWMDSPTKLRRASYVCFGIATISTPFYLALYWISSH
jgi:membrane protein insertase Oxa1/YidC/SpoIIIJ